MPETNHLITRRRSLAVIGSGSAGVLLAGAGLGPSSARAHSEGDDHVANAADACVLTAEQEEGPFYVALDNVRSDLVLDQKGLAMKLTITVISSLTCKPLRHAAVDIWSCNASGVYSDITSEKSFGEYFLRGVQFTDAHGQVTFDTIYPGHYAGRTTHIHLRVHINSGEYRGKLVGGHVAHTGQMFPSDAVNAEVYKLSPYSAETVAVVTHADDRVYTEQHGSEGLLKLTKLGNRLTKGVEAAVTFAVNPNATPAMIGATSSASVVDGQGGGSSSGGPGGTGGTPPAGGPRATATAATATATATAATATTTATATATATTNTTNTTNTTTTI